MIHPVDGSGVGGRESQGPTCDDVVSCAARALRAGEIVAIPTDTVYGLAAALDRPDAIERLYAVKGRPDEKAIPVLVSDTVHVLRLTALLSSTAAHLAQRFWPGALTLVLPALPALPRGVTTVARDGTRTIAVRLPDNALARAIIAAAGGALAVTSANLSGAEPAVEAREVTELDLSPPLLVIDGGRTPGGVPSTIVAVASDVPKILRHGAITAAAIEAAMAELELNGSAAAGARYDQLMTRQAGNDAREAMR